MALHITFLLSVYLFIWVKSDTDLCDGNIQWTEDNPVGILEAWLKSQMIRQVHAACLTSLPALNLSEGPNNFIKGPFQCPPEGSFIQYEGTWPNESKL